MPLNTGNGECLLLRRTLELLVTDGVDVLLSHSALEFLSFIMADEILQDFPYQVGGSVLSLAYGRNAPTCRDLPLVAVAVSCITV